MRHRRGVIVILDLFRRFHSCLLSASRELLFVYSDNSPFLFVQKQRDEPTFLLRVVSAAAAGTCVF